MVYCFRSMKYRLCRQSLNTIFKSFILPLFDYADVIWDNCSEQDSNKLEQLQLDAIHTITGLVRGTSHAVLYRESGYTPLSERRKRHKIILFYKMINKLVPQYLSIFVPPTISLINPYPVRNQGNLRTIATNSTQYQVSFRPSAVELWNSQSEKVKLCETIATLKRSLSETDSKIPTYHYTGNRTTQILHCRLRHSKSDLNAHKFSMFISDDPRCPQGHPLENADHSMP
ncbi:hypothetical protein LOTGIDRAFT_152089 [Lottia gigantea]|uniref:Uncharacterized protein n=1 Tax=Lottia gigantea TaxID=225164 RepID=V4B485_LOTGI|nr:hypothetical protein LOTGIDRAFT_152089 [Lottia gigantea]ESP05263.1 hypothetical protein LOTGIDRAFT_152089 [Lottia gigantea]